MMNRSAKICLSAWSMLMPALVFAAEPQANLERKTTIDVTAASPRDVYGSLAKVLGCELILAPEIQGPVTVKIPNVTVRTALNAISESLGSSWQLVGGKLHVGRPSATAPSAAGAGVSRGIGSGVGPGTGPGQGSGVDSGSGGGTAGVIAGVPGGVVGGVQRRISVSTNLKERLDRKTPGDFRFDNTLVDEVLSSLSKIMEMEVRIEGLEAGKRVTLDLRNQTVFSSLKAVQDQVGGKGLIFVFDAGGKKQVSVRVMPPKPKK